MRVTRHERKAIFQHLKKLDEISTLICFSFCQIPEPIFFKVENMNEPIGAAGTVSISALHGNQGFVHRIVDNPWPL